MASASSTSPGAESSTPNSNNPDPLSNFANLPFLTSPDPSAVSLLWNAAQPFLEIASDGVSGGADNALLGPTNSEAINGESAASNEGEAASPEVEANRASEYLTAVSLRIDSLEMAVRYAGMNGMGRELLSGSVEGGMEEGWNVLLPQVLDVVVAAGIASTLCKGQPHKITSSGILPTLLRLIETANSVSCPPDLHPKLAKGTIAHDPSKTTHCLSSFHPEYLLCAILSQQFRHAQRFLSSHPVRSHSLLLSSSNSNGTATPRLDPAAYLRYHYYSGIVHAQCLDWNRALDSFHLCLTIPCGGNLNAVSPISVAARKKMLLVRCLLLEAGEMDGPNNAIAVPSSLDRKNLAVGKTKKSLIENKVLEMPGAASQVMSRYMSNPSNRVGVTREGGESSAPDERGEDGSTHAPRRKHPSRRDPSSSSESGPERGPPLTAWQTKSIRQLGRYHDLVSTYVSGNSAHYATLLEEMRDSLVAEGNWDLAKRLEGRLVYRSVREVASVYSVVGMEALEGKVRESCGAAVQEVMGCRRRVEDCLMGMAGCDWEDVLVTDPFYARMDQRTNVVTFIESDSAAMFNEEEEERYLECDLSKRMESCIGLAERVRDLDIMLTTSTRYQQQVAKWEVKGDALAKPGGVADLGHTPLNPDWTTS